MEKPRGEPMSAVASACFGRRRWARLQKIPAIFYAMGGYVVLQSPRLRKIRQPN
jgi:hypothetical protein